MKNKGIVFFLIVLAIVIVTVVTLDYYSSKPGEISGNPYELKTDPFDKVDTTLIMFNESRDLAIGFDQPTGIAFRDGEIFVVGDQKMQIIEPSGKLLKELTFVQAPTLCLCFCGQNICGVPEIGFGVGPHWIEDRRLEHFF